MLERVEVMSDVELLGALVGGRTAARVLREVQGSLASLLGESAAGYEARPAVNATLRVAKELVRRALLEPLRRGDALTSPALVREFLRITLALRPYEVFLVLFLDAQNRIIEVEEVARGTLTQTSVYPREVLKRCLARNAANVIFAQNRPYLAIPLWNEGGRVLCGPRCPLACPQAQALPPPNRPRPAQQRGGGPPAGG